MMTAVDPSRTVAELLLENPSRAAIFEHHGIDYCCNGKKTLTEACQRRGLKIDAVIIELESPANGETRAGVCAASASLNCAGLVRHIVDTHHAFLRNELPRLDHIASKVARVHGDHAPECIAIRDIFKSLRAELEHHMGKEEEVLFPFIEKLERGLDSPFPTIGLPIDCMEHEHSDAGLALERLRALTNGYNPPADACNSWRMLYHGLAEIERDLHQHIHEENNILFPRALAMEGTIRSTCSRHSA